MRRASIFLAAALSAMTLGGCVVRGGLVATAEVSEPEMVYVSPGVYVVADQSEPIFYHGNHYWLYRGGFWYRSGRYSGGWVRWSSRPPQAVVSIRSPHSYIRVRAQGRGHVNKRDHRDNRREDKRDNRRRGPDVRDHRTH